MLVVALLAMSKNIATRPYEVEENPSNTLLNLYGTVSKPVKTYRTTVKHIKP